jgi:Rrf2 family protein
MISRTGIHATLALSALATLEPGEFAGAAEIAARVGAPRNYLGKLLKQLGEQGLLESQRGSGGGFRLARPAGQITLLDVLEPLERVSKWNGCFLGKSSCLHDGPCAVHKRWAKTREAYLGFLRTTTIAEIAKDGPPLAPD